MKGHPVYVCVCVCTVLYVCTVLCVCTVYVCKCHECNVCVPVNLLVVGVCVCMCFAWIFTFVDIFRGPSNCWHNCAEPCLGAHLF